MPVQNMLRRGGQPAEACPMRNSWKCQGSHRPFVSCSRSPGSSSRNGSRKNSGLFLAGDFSSSSDLYFLLRHHLKRIGIKAEGPTQECVLSPDHLKPVGFELHQELIPYPTQSFPGYRVIQEYFILPEKFLFLDLTGWEKWRDREDAARFEVRFELAELPFRPTRLRRDNFVLSATPAINIFPHEADPVRLDHKKTEYPVRPSGTELFALPGLFHREGCRIHPRHRPGKGIFVVRPVHSRTRIGTGLPRDPEKVRRCAPKRVSTYRSPIPRNTGLRRRKPFPSILCAPTVFCPRECEWETFRNPPAARQSSWIFPTSRRRPRAFCPLWEATCFGGFLSHLSLNYVSLAKAENLRALLELYVFEKGRDRTLALANKRRIAGLEKLVTKPADRLVSGILMRGREIMLSARNDHFASQGDLYLFGCVLDYFLGAYASMNSFTTLKLKEVLRGDLYQWPPRIGERPLI